ncbi:MAG: hypothetical protein DLM69_10475 [Candidatus Chloroheliales bacterium]|nr:MAG: hypothetical protein DLM69_10475 [Chloroflexota bacterium]
MADTDDDAAVEQVVPPLTQGVSRRVRRGWLLTALAVALVAMLGSGLALLTGGTVDAPPLHNAQEIIARAEAAYKAGKVQSFALSRTTRYLPPASRNGPPHDQQYTYSQQRLWYQAPHRWRDETSSDPPVDDANPTSRHDTNLRLSDGVDLWSYFTVTPSVGIHDPSMGAAGGVIVGRMAEFWHEPPTTPLLGYVLNSSVSWQELRNCYTPVLSGTTTIVGRPAYIISLGTSHASCGQSMADTSGGRLVWLDRETYFVLKDESYNQAGQPVSSVEVTAIQYNQPLDPALFSFTPPPDASVEDKRPATAKGATQLRHDVLQVADRLYFATFLPTTLPVELAPFSLGYYQPAAQLTLTYMPRSEITQPKGQGLLNIYEQPVVSNTLKMWQQSAIPIDVGSRPGWLRQSSRDQDGNGSDAAVMLVLSDTMVTVTSSAYSTDQLLATAASLAPLPPGLPPASRPTATPAPVLPTPVPTASDEALVPAPPALSTADLPNADATNQPLPTIATSPTPNPEIAAPFFGANPRHIQMLSPTEGWAVGYGIFHYHASRWFKVDGLKADYAPLDIAMLSPTEGWVVGSVSNASLRGLILHYQAGVWTRVDALTTTLPLRSIAMSSADEGWAVGEMNGGYGCSMYHYTAGHWQAVDCPISVPLNRVRMLSADDGWAVGEGGAILHYTAGRWQVVAGFGSDYWQNAPNRGPTKGHLADLQMLSPTEGWAVGSEPGLFGGYHAVMLHYHAGVWQAMSGSDNVSLSGVSFSAPDDGWAVSDNYNYTPDFPATLMRYHAGAWQAVDSPNDAPLACVQMLSASEGWAMGDSAALHYQDGRWTVDNGFISTSVDALTMVSPTEGWAVGSFGAVQHYTAGHWQRVSSPTVHDLSAVSFANPGDGWAVGDNVILHYTAGGWRKVANPGGHRLYSVQMLSPADGWAVGEYGTILRYQNGQWAAVASPTKDSLFGLSMVSAADGWAVSLNNTTSGSAPATYLSSILRYQDGRWAKVSIPGAISVTSIQMSGPDNGWAVGQVSLHYQGGQWQLVPNPTGATVRRVFAFSKGDAWAVSDGGQLLRYQNGVWQNAASPPRGYSAFMVAADDGWAFSIMGEVLRYQNGAWRKTAG